MVDDIAVVFAKTKVYELNQAIKRLHDMGYIISPMMATGANSVPRIQVAFIEPSSKGEIINNQNEARLS